MEDKKGVDATFSAEPPPPQEVSTTSSSTTTSESSPLSNSHTQRRDSVGSTMTVDDNTQQSSQATQPDSFAHRRRTSIVPLRTTNRRNSDQAHQEVVPTDEYGFINMAQTSHLASSHVDKKEAQWRQWTRLVDSDGTLPKEASAVKEAVRLGIPVQHRAMAWFLYSGGRDLQRAQTDLFQSLVLPRTIESIMHAFDDDFPHLLQGNVKFKTSDRIVTPIGSFIEEPVKPPLYINLKRVVGSLLLYKPTLSYSIQLCAVCALLVLVIEDAEKAFWTAVALLTSLPSDLFEDTVSQVFVDRDAFSGILATLNPRLYAHFQALDVPLNIFIGSWFQALFINILPPQCYLRVFDSLIYEGPKILYRTALAIFRINEHALLSCLDGNELTSMLRALPRSQYDHFELMWTAFERIGGLPQSVIDRECQIARQRQAETAQVRRFSMSTRRMSLASRTPTRQ